MTNTLIRVLLAAAYTAILLTLQHFLGFRPTVLIGMGMIMAYQVRLEQRQ